MKKLLTAVVILIAAGCTGCVENHPAPPQAITQTTGAVMVRWIGPNQDRPMYTTLVLETDNGFRVSKVLCEYPDKLASGDRVEIQYHFVDPASSESGFNCDRITAVRAIK